MPQQIACPVCRRRLTVADAAPNWLTCPNCIAKIDRSALPSLMAEPSVGPRPALAVDAESSRDSRAAVILLIVLVVLVLLGTVPLVAQAGSAAVVPVVIILGMAAFLALYIRRSWTKAVDRAASEEFPAIVARARSGPPPLPPQAGNVLGYSQARRGYERVSMAAFAAGFILALLVCGGGVVLLGATAVGGPGKRASGLYLLLVLAAVVVVAVLGGTVGGKPGWRGFGPGVACGLGLGMLALGPCGFCYLLSLQ